MRRFLARALAVLLLALAITLVWNGINEFRWAEGIAYAVPILQLIAAPIVALGGHWLWRLDRRSLLLTAIGLALAAAAGAIAAWYYTPDAERPTALMGALGGGVVFTVAVVLLARMSFKSATVSDSTDNEASSAPH
ncbi:MAG: hypothetical protein AB1762_00210 [Gemmatimonadota bacterium]